ncbi:MAG: fumarate/nitrate reduction transcriptional regulator Fnr [Natronospirillum sp.]|uniref:fumarate/nitrate reduction transcriptional regulator Fnr n=1 Tax=Natronospirillum sp. TaxID=2812955 RepID=UPI0025EA4FA8|nr:fumarate/nitrate reduction transcriptional regulator Fnr [Natronospirillum sp.]MCH8551183.1 fumarate/nitrate reduction transcriptional regulator Fnr [Natronospirillum sp.]
MNQHMRHNTACKTCSLSPLCLPVSLSFSEMDRLDDIIERGRPIEKGQYLFRQGDPMESVFAIRTGTIKSFALTRAGEEQITGFHLPSEILGLSSFGTQHHQVSARALETTNVCEIPLEHLERLSSQLPELGRQVMRVMGREIREDQQMMLLLSKKSAEERLASFLLSLAQRFKRRGYSEHNFRLTMSRSDMANYLGLAVETVSRVFTRLQKSGIIADTGSAREVHIADQKRLCDMASLSEGERVELGLIETTTTH